MAVRAIALLSGGLDSMLAIRILQTQGIEVEAINFRTTFTCCQDQAARAAEELGVRLSIISEQDDYLDIIRRPRHGYGRGANPCVDCRIYMFRAAGRYMRESRAAMVASGEVVGQRPMSQKKRDLAVIARCSGLDDRLLRPLSARLLPETWPEREKLIDREQLFGISGRGRTELIALAKELGLSRIPQPSTGCALTEPKFAAKVFDLIGNDTEASRWQFELLKIGRHFRHERATKIVLGRRAEENEQLARIYEQHRRGQDALLVPRNFLGPTALVLGAANKAALDFAGGLMLKYSKGADEREAVAVVHTAAGQRLARLEAQTAAAGATSI